MYDFIDARCDSNCDSKCHTRFRGESGSSIKGGLLKSSFATSPVAVSQLQRLICCRIVKLLILKGLFISD